MKSGYVAVYGRANAGKSTLINACLGFKLLPVSSKPQTTRDNVRAIYNDPDTQIVFTDSPGVFRPHGKLGSILLRDAESVKEGVDVIAYVVDAKEVPDFSLCEKLRSEKTPIILCFNKVDLVHADIGEDRLGRYVENLPKLLGIVRMSAKDGYGVDEFLSLVKSVLPEGERIFPEDMVSDRPMAYIVSEMIREKCMRLLKAEVPHSIYVDIRAIEEKDEEMEVFADIIVEKVSEKGIVVGKNGRMISKIRQYSEKTIGEYFGVKTHIDLLVKAIPDWRNSDRYLRKFGYEE